MSEQRIEVTANEALLKHAMEMSKRSTPAEVIDAALDAYAKHFHRLDLVKMVGTIDFRDDFDIKAMRQNRSEKRNAS